MRNPAADPDQLTMQDFWCDFCHAPWTDELPMVEGHQGSLVCAKCLAVAYAEVIAAKASVLPGSPKCVMCLENRKDRNWSSPRFEGAVICERCIRQAATALSHDESSGWKPPASASA